MSFVECRYKDVNQEQYFLRDDEEILRDGDINSKR